MKTMLLAMGLFAVLNWLIVVFFDRIQRWEPPWGTTEKRPSMDRIGKAMMIGFACLVSLIFVVTLVNAISR